MSNFATLYLTMTQLEIYEFKFKLIKIKKEKPPKKWKSQVQCIKTLSKIVQFLPN